MISCQLLVNYKGFFNLMYIIIIIIIILNFVLGF
jgi:hypothetical protein